MARKFGTLIPVVVVLVLSACATAGRSTPPEPERVHPDWLIGTWQGSAWQVGASNTQGEMSFSVTFQPGGAWKASTGASGTSWLVGDRVILDGTAADGASIRYTLKEREDARGHEMWGVAEATFGQAAVSMKRVL